MANFHGLTATIEHESAHARNFTSATLPAFSPVFHDLATTVDLTAAGENIVDGNVVTGYTAVPAYLANGISLMSATSVAAGTNNQNHFRGVLQDELSPRNTDGSLPMSRKRTSTVATSGFTRCRVNGAITVGQLLQPSPGNSYLVAYDGTGYPVAEALQANASGTAVRLVLIRQPNPVVNGGQAVLRANWAWNSTTPLFIGILPQGATVLRTELVVDVAVIGNTWALDVGYLTGVTTNDLLNFGLDVGASPAIGTYGVTRSNDTDLVPYEATVDRRLIATITVGNGSAGSGRIFVHVGL